GSASVDQRMRVATKRAAVRCPAGDRPSGAGRRMMSPATTRAARMAGSFALGPDSTAAAAGSRVITPCIGIMLLCADRRGPADVRDTASALDETWRSRTPYPIRLDSVRVAADTSRDGEVFGGGVFRDLAAYRS